MNPPLDPCKPFSAVVTCELCGSVVRAWGYPPAAASHAVSEALRCGWVRQSLPCGQSRWVCSQCFPSACEPGQFIDLEV